MQVNAVRLVMGIRVKVRNLKRLTDLLGIPWPRPGGAVVTAETGSATAEFGATGGIALWGASCGVVLCAC